MQTQRIHFARAADGVSVAYCTTGSEQPPLLLVNGWVSHLELDLESPDFVHFLEGLSGDGKRQIIRMDHRGCGLSTRDVEDVSAGARARDIEAVVDQMGLEKVAIFAWSMNGPAAVIYAAKHPEKVSHLILYGTFATHKHSGRESLGRALVDLIRADWRIASNAIVEFEVPGADRETTEQLKRYQLAASSGQVAAAMLEEALFGIDVTSLLPALTMPTLVLHRRDDQAFPASCGRELASGLPHGHFVPLPGNEHPPFYGDTDAVVEAVHDFLSTADGHDQLEAEDRARVRVAPGLQIILFTDMEGSTGLTQRLGDEAAQELVRTHNSIVREALAAHGGAEIKHTGDGIMASFLSASGAVECALAIQRAVADYDEANPESPIRVRIGLNAGEPVAEGEDLFGTAVQLASRIAARAEPGQVLVSDVVRQLAAGKGFLFSDEGNTVLRGFEDPVRLFGVRT
jgi:class 3 adenylate cyclase/pimeloyl-ACP methyl ester carboxylesterase